jgi:hypothetical protein
VIWSGVVNNDLVFINDEEGIHINNIVLGLFAYGLSDKFIVDGSYIIQITGYQVNIYKYIKSTNIINTSQLTFPNDNINNTGIICIVNMWTKIVYFTETAIVTSSYLVNGYTDSSCFTSLTSSDGSGHNLAYYIPGYVSFAVFDGQFIWACSGTNTSTSNYLYKIELSATTYTITNKASIALPLSVAYLNKKIFILSSDSIYCYNIITNTMQTRTLSSLGYSGLTWIFTYDSHILTRFGDNLIKIA